MKAKHQKQAGEKLKLWQQRLALSNAAYSAEYARMDQRERIYNGDHQLRQGRGRAQHQPCAQHRL